MTKLTEKEASGLRGGLGGSRRRIKGRLKGSGTNKRRLRGRYTQLPQHRGDARRMLNVLRILSGEGLLRGSRRAETPEPVPCAGRRDTVSKQPVLAATHRPVAGAFAIDPSAARREQTSLIIQRRICGSEKPECRPRPDSQLPRIADKMPSKGLRDGKTAQNASEIRLQNGLKTASAACFALPVLTLWPA